MGYAVVFAGQGMQHAGMLPWLRPDDLVQQTCASLGVADWRAAMADAAWPFRNENAQVLLTGISLAAWGQVAPQLPPPSAVAGYSVGELASFAAAGVFDSATALVLARVRSAAMDRCAAQHPGGLMGVSGLLAPQVQQLCTDFDLEVAIDNGHHSAVLGGALSALNQAEHLATAWGGHVTRLSISLASHTRGMQAAVPELAQALGQHSLRAPRIPLFANALDRVSTATQAVSALSQQIAQTVRWSDCMDNIHARRVSCVLELGPGAALARMWNQRFAEVPARSVDEFASVASIVQWVRRHSGD